MLQVQEGSQLHLQTRTGFPGPDVLPWTSSLTALGCLLQVLQVTVGTKAGDIPKLLPSPGEGYGRL